MSVMCNPGAYTIYTDVSNVQTKGIQMSVMCNTEAYTDTDASDDDSLGQHKARSTNYACHL